jgi:hypothetical protein
LFALLLLLTAAAKKPIKAGASSGHISMNKPKQSILETFDSYGLILGEIKAVRDIRLRNVEIVNKMIT